jgi:hypothetical protein
VNFLVDNPLSPAWPSDSALPDTMRSTFLTMECTPPPTKPSSSAFGTYRSRVSARKTSETSGTCESAPAPRSLRTDSGGAGPGRRFDRTQNGSRIHPAPKSDDASARGKVGLRGPTRGARRRHSSSPASPVSHPGPAWSTWGRHRRRREAAGGRARSIGRKGPVDGTAVLRPPRPPLPPLPILPSSTRTTASRTESAPVPCKSVPERIACTA